MYFSGLGFEQTVPGLPSLREVNPRKINHPEAPAHRAPEADPDLLVGRALPRKSGK